MCFFERERKGIATREAQATTIPPMLCAGECLCSRFKTATEAIYAESAKKQTATILSVKRSFLSRFSSSAISDSRHNNATAEVTSIKLSIPKPTREMLPEIIPVANAVSPSRLFHPIVTYSRRLPRCTIMARSVELCGTTDFTLAVRQSRAASRRLAPQCHSFCAEQLTQATCSKLKVYACGSASAIRERPALVTPDWAADSFMIPEHDSKKRR